MQCPRGPPALLRISPVDVHSRVQGSRPRSLTWFFPTAPQKTLRTSPAKIKSTTTPLVGPRTMDHGGPLSECDSSLPRQFHANPALMAALFLEAGGEQVPQGCQRNWAWAWAWCRIREHPSSTCKTAQKRSYWAPSSVLVFPDFLPHLAPPWCSVPWFLLSCSVLLVSCTFFFPLKLPVLYKPPLVLCHLGGSCLLASLAAFLGMPCSGVASWSPSLRRTLPGHFV